MWASRVDFVVRRVERSVRAKERREGVGGTVAREVGIVVVVVAAASEGEASARNLARIRRWWVSVSVGEECECGWGCEEREREKRGLVEAGVGVENVVEERKGSEVVELDAKECWGEGRFSRIGWEMPSSV
jgi:hypothetical protein